MYTIIVSTAIWAYCRIAHVCLWYFKCHNWYKECNWIEFLPSSVYYLVYGDLFSGNAPWEKCMQIRSLQNEKNILY